MFIDSHIHFGDAQFDNDREDVLKRAQDAGVLYFINIGSDVQSSREAVEFARKHPGVFAAVGVHPHEAKTFSEVTKRDLLELMRDEKVVAIGEIGLDYYYKHSPPEVQKRVFAEQLRMAAYARMPVVIHIRDAWQDAEAVIESAVGNIIKGVFHYYSGDAETALRLIKKNFLISFGGCITFKNFKNTGVLEAVPTEKMLIETDAPYMAPEPYRGKRNEPMYIPLIAQRVAEIKHLSQADIGRITVFNANRLWGIAPEMEKPTVVYQIRDSLYINPTLQCTADCVFCPRLVDPIVKGYNLKIRSEDEPTPEETIILIGNPTKYKEVVFCGYGEPLLRLDFIKTVGRWLKGQGVKVRLNTNGHGNLIYNRNIAQELVGIIDEVSISLNTDNPEQYLKLSRNIFAEKSFNGLIDFIKQCAAAGIKTVITVVDIPNINIEACRNIAHRLGVEFRVRTYNELG
jgi:TatD DNase family protein